MDLQKRQIRMISSYTSGLLIITGIFYSIYDNKFDVLLIAIIFYLLLFYIFVTSFIIPKRKWFSASFRAQIVLSCQMILFGLILLLLHQPLLEKIFTPILISGIASLLINILGLLLSTDRILQYLLIPFTINDSNNIINPENNTIDSASKNHSNRVKK